MTTTAPDRVRPARTRSDQSPSDRAPTGRPARRVRRSARGFSLLELLLVLVILGLLAGAAALAVGNIGARARISTTKTNLSTIKSAIEAYKLEKGSPPVTLAELYPGYLEPGKAETDAWKSPFYYKYDDSSADPQRPYMLLSYGPDKKPNTPDDIDVWTMEQGST